jgi:hypothetical protein
VIVIRLTPVGSGDAHRGASVVTGGGDVAGARPAGAGVEDGVDGGVDAVMDGLMDGAVGRVAATADVSAVAAPVAVVVDVSSVTRQPETAVATTATPISSPRRIMRRV